MATASNRKLRRLSAAGAVGLTIGLSAAVMAPIVGASASAPRSCATDVGVTCTQITIGATVPLTGPASSGYDQVAQAADAVFKYVNARGGIDGRKINYITLNDAYNTGIGVPAGTTTLSQTKILVQDDNVFATVGSLGTPTQETVESYLNENGVPQLFVNSGSVYWNNPSTYPMLFGWQTDYTVEGKILGAYIKKTYKTDKVGFIGQDDDFGASALVGLDAEDGANVAAHTTYDATAIALGAKLTTQIGDMKTAKAKIVYLATIPAATKLALSAAAAIGYKPIWVISSVGADPSTVNNKAENGAISFTWLPPVGASPTAWIKWTEAVLKAYPPSYDPTAYKKLNGNVEYGVGWGVTFVELLEALGTNLTRADLVAYLNAHGSSIPTPAMVPLAYSATDHQGYQGGEVIKIKSPADTAAAVSGTLAVTTDSPTSAITKVTAINKAIPSFLGAG